MLYRTIFGLKVWVASLILLVLALPLFYAQSQVGEPWASVLGGLASTVAPVALLTLIYELWLRQAASQENREVIEAVWRAREQDLLLQISQQTSASVSRAIDENGEQLRSALFDGIRLSRTVQSAGIRDVGNFGTIRWDEFFSRDGDIDICASYAETWARTNAWTAVKSAAQHGRRVRVTLLDPNGPHELLSFYAAMYAAADVAAFQGRIHSAHAIWRDQVRRVREEGGSVRLVIEGISRHVPYTFYSCGDLMWLVLAPRRAGRQPGEQIPALLCAKTGTPEGLFDWAAEDVAACRRDHDATLLEEVADES